MDCLYLYNRRRAVIACNFCSFGEVFSIKQKQRLLRINRLKVLPAPNVGLMLAHRLRRRLKITQHWAIACL